MSERATGDAPFRRNNAIATFHAIVHEEPKPLRQVRPELPEALEWIVNRCLAKDSRRRYQSAAELAEDASVRAGIRLKIFKKKRQLERSFALLGKTVHGLHTEKKDNVMASPKVKSGLKEIKALEADILKMLKP